MAHRLVCIGTTAAGVVCSMLVAERLPFLVAPMTDGRYAITVEVSPEVLERLIGSARRAVEVEEQPPEAEEPAKGATPLEPKPNWTDSLEIHDASSEKEAKVLALKFVKAIGATLYPGGRWQALGKVMQVRDGYNKAGRPGQLAIWRQGETWYVEWRPA